jgi:hypothetical protein
MILFLRVNARLWDMTTIADIIRSLGWLQYIAWNIDWKLCIYWIYLLVFKKMSQYNCNILLISPDFRLF